MTETIKVVIRELLIYFKIDITKNIKYDRLTRKILKNVLRPSDSCIDVGCHKGEILDLMRKYAPKGNHFAFEPIPFYYNNLKNRYKDVAIFPYALADKNGEAIFNYVKNAPAYSGLKKRTYAIDNPDIEKIPVEIKQLDTIIASNQSIGLIKIDVEGAELGVLKGAQALLTREQPLLIFECGLGASEFYGTTPAMIFTYLCETLNYRLYTLEGFDKKAEYLTEVVFTELYQQNKEYYFVAQAIA